MGLYAACGIGALACAILVANNLRDIPTDQVAGKRTLAVLLGDRAPARSTSSWSSPPPSPWSASPPPRRGGRWSGLPADAGRAVGVVRRASGRDLVPALQLTGIAELVWPRWFAGLLVGAT